MDREKTLSRLADRPAPVRVNEAARVVAKHRRLIRRAMRMGHNLATLSEELKLPKRALQKELYQAGLFWRKPKTKKVRAIKRNLAAIRRAKMAALANV